MWTHISVTDDPIFLAEPLIKSEDLTLNANPNSFNPFWPCEYIEEGERARGEVPHYLPGENPWVAEYAATHNLPQEVDAGRAGADVSGVSGADEEASGGGVRRSERGCLRLLPLRRDEDRDRGAGRRSGWSASWDAAQVREVVSESAH